VPKSKTHSREQVAAFLEELKSQTDRGTAVIAAAVLDDLLDFGTCPKHTMFEFEGKAENMYSY
jgi:hypothetical protein